MKLLLSMIVLLLQTSPQSDRSAADLGWLAGRWVAEEKGGWIEESWSAPRGGVILGTNLSGKAGKATSYEFMRITADGNGRLTFWGSPGGLPAVAFVLVDAGPFEAVFANPGHDYPQRIAYRRAGTGLVATISRADGSGARSWRFRRTHQQP